MRALAIGVVAASVALAVVATVLSVLNVGTERPQELSLGSTGSELTAPVGILIIAAIGLLIARRYPRHPVVWCFLFLTFTAEVFLCLLNYYLYGAVTAPGSLPGAQTARGIVGWFWAVPGFAIPMATLLFPDGRPPSPRWRPMVWLVIVAMFVAAIRDALELDWLTPLAIVGWMLAYVGPGISLVVRFRRATGIERQQLKWITYASCVVVTVAVLGIVTPEFPVVGPFLTAASSMVGILIPLTAALAILRYRLYDIDIVIERTLVYATVTASLGATYVLAVIVLQTVLRPVTGGSDIAVALSTLLVVALFHPIRRRAQDAIDRRFYRARYDATRTVDAFIARLRNEVELDNVRAHLLDVVNATVRPAHAGMWLRSRR